jgi:hypothetical protein
LADAGSTPAALSFMQAYNFFTAETPRRRVFLFHTKIVKPHMTTKKIIDMPPSAE